VHLEASTKPHVHQKFEIFWTNIASTIACPNFINGPKIGLRPLGVKQNTVKNNSKGIEIKKTLNYITNGHIRQRQATKRM
jgi:hypothetical protein